LEDKNVLIIGIGSSAGDIAVELGRAAKQVLRRNFFSLSLCS
jgi:cation diffusion facilitator CzcD-associated flavoprotein CzcO